MVTVSVRNMLEHRVGIETGTVEKGNFCDRSAQGDRQSPSNKPTAAVMDITAIEPRRNVRDEKKNRNKCTEALKHEDAS